MEEDSDEENPKRFKIKPKVYVIGFFALMYLIKNLYSHFTTERAGAKPA